MSLVGPRPIVPSEMSRYGDRLDSYVLARPGLTGAWQISGRSDCGYDKRVELDANYVSDWRFSTDLSILARTVGCRYRAEGKLLTVQAPISLARDLCTPKQKSAVSLAQRKGSASKVAGFHAATRNSSCSRGTRHQFSTDYTISMFEFVFRQDNGSLANAGRMRRRHGPEIITGVLQIINRTPAMIADLTFNKWPA